MRNAGKLVIVAMLAIALAAVGLSTWYHYQGQYRSQDFWGTTSAVLIADGPHVKALQLTDAPLDSTSDEATGGEQGAVEFGGLSWKVLASKEADEARGVGNIRRALVLDATFDWRAGARDDEPNWQYALEFNDGRLWATVLFDFDSRRVALTGGRRTALLDPAAADDWLKFFGEQFGNGPVGGPDEKSADKPGEKPVGSPADKPDDKPDASILLIPSWPRGGV